MRHHTRTLLVVGVRNDCCEGGSLAAVVGPEVCRPTNRFVRATTGVSDLHGLTGQEARASSASEGVGDTGRPLLDGLDVGVAADTSARALAEMRAAGVEVGR
jgi:hypothetical protein